MNPLLTSTVASSALVSEIVSSETLVVMSNFALVIATFLLVGVTVREAHRTVRDVVKSDNRLLAKILGPLLVKPEPGTHKRTSDDK
jgi:hypothetical protein